MLKKTVIVIVITEIIIVAALSAIYSGKESQRFIRARKGILVSSIRNKEIRLRGVCFGNRVWEKIEVPDTHHNEKDFKRLKQMGMNAVRFYMYYGTFENSSRPYTYKKRGWQWLDKNVAWAKKHGVYLILNMHVPQGGFQSLARGTALWENRENRKRLIALWKAIAQRYRDEPVIAAYDLLNEPVTTKSVDQWRDLAREIIDAIRTVDQNHLIIVEKLLGVRNKWETYADVDYTQFLVNDRNVMYQFHFYLPIEYTHQTAPWTPFEEGGKYPDRSLWQMPEDLTWYKTTEYNTKVPSGDSGWTFYEGKMYRVTDPKEHVGFPVFVSRNNSGTVYFDAFEIREYNSNKKFLRNVYSINIKDKTGWQHWSRNGKGDFDNSGFSGYRDSYSLTIGDTSSDANYTGKYYPFKPRSGYYYQINGWMKGNDVSSNADCYMRIDFYRSKKNIQLQKRNIQYLESRIKELVRFGRRHNVPMYCGEFGVYRECFKNSKGGLRWVGDTLRLLDKYKVNYTYHAYHEDSFGIYYNARTLPSKYKANTGLVQLFTRYLKKYK